MPATRAVVGASVPGAVVRVAVAEGDRVAAGAVLVELDATAAEAEVAAAGAALDAAAARSEQAVATSAQAKAEVARTTEAWRAARASETSCRAARPRRGSGRRTPRWRRAGRDRRRARGQGRRRRGREGRGGGRGRGLGHPRCGAGRRRPADDHRSHRRHGRGRRGDGRRRRGRRAPLVRIAGDGGWTFETTDLTQDEVAAIDVGGDAVVTLDGFAGAPIAGRVERISAFGEDRQGDVVFTVVVVPSGRSLTGSAGTCRPRSRSRPRRDRAGNAISLGLAGLLLLTAGCGTPARPRHRLRPRRRPRSPRRANGQASDLDGVASARPLPSAAARDHVRRYRRGGHPPPRTRRLGTLGAEVLADPAAREAIAAKYPGSGKLLGGAGRLGSRAEPVFLAADPSPASWAARWRRTSACSCRSLGRGPAARRRRRVHRGRPRPTCSGRPGIRPGAGHAAGG